MAGAPDLDPPDETGPPGQSLVRDPLDGPALQAAIVPISGLWTEIRVVPEVGSTNTEVAAMARAGAREGLVLVADHQTAGRGRLARSWVSPPGAGLAVSMLLRPVAVPASQWPWLPLLVGVAVAEALAQLGLPVDLKWPNDVLVADAKLGGILVERVECPAAIVGVGLNVSNGPGEIPEGATSLALAGVPEPSRASVLHAVLDEIEKLYVRWRAEAGRSSPWLSDAYRSRCATIGRQVRVLLPADRVVTGWAVDVDEHGRLMVDPAEGGPAIPIQAGDVVHVRLPPSPERSR